MELLLLHPGDLSLSDWIRVLLMGLACTVLPLGIIGLLIYKLVKRHSSDDDDGSRDGRLS